MCARYCYECINKATGERHCLVCGGQDGGNLLLCTSCPRAYHMTCIQPALTKVSTMLYSGVLPVLLVKKYTS